MICANTGPTVSISPPNVSPIVAASVPSVGPNRFATSTSAGTIPVDINPVTASSAGPNAVRIVDANPASGPRSGATVPARAAMFNAKSNRGGPTVTTASMIAPSGSLSTSHTSPRSSPASNSPIPDTTSPIKGSAPPTRSPSAAPAPAATSPMPASDATRSSTPDPAPPMNDAENWPSDDAIGPTESDTTCTRPFSWSVAPAALNASVSPCDAVSFNVDSTPSSVVDCRSIAPAAPGNSRIPSSSAFTPTSAFTAPAEISFVASSVDTPICFATAATPLKPGIASPICSSSSNATFPRPLIWPSAVVTRCTPSAPTPAAAARSPIACNIGTTDSAANPAPTSFCVASVSSGNSNGVFAANAFSSSSFA